MPKNLPRALWRALALFGLLVAPLAGWSAYPDKTIEWVVPYNAGGGSDIVARTLSEQMGKALGQTIVILNKPGAATNIGADYVARAKPDGYTILTADTATLAANPFLYSKLRYDAAKDFAPIGLMARFPLILVVNPKVPATNLKEFLAWAKKQPQGVNYASPGTGSPHHLATELFKEETGLKLTHVPYKGAAPAVQDVMGGTVPFMFVDTAGGQQYIRAGKLVPIGVASLERVKGFEKIPTLAEQGVKGFEAYAWQGIVAPAGTPKEVVDMLNKALNDALASPAVQARFQTLGLEAIPSTPEEMADYAKSEREKWGKIIKANHLKVD